jgi:CheY-like chemotaxis protein
MESMFELFEQGRRDASRTPGGLGIGLTVVKQPVEMHQGTVEARSAGRDKGSEFVARLPRAQPPEDSGNRSSKEKLLEISTPKGAKMRVLVVDDSTDAADLLAKGITLLGGQALAIYTASEALRQVREWRPDVVILDIGLPEMDGYQLAQEISKRCEPLPRLIALTGYGQPEDRARSRSAGFDLHLVKPITLETLSEVLGLRSDSSE